MIFVFCVKRCALLFAMKGSVFMLKNVMFYLVLVSLKVVS